MTDRQAVALAQFTRAVERLAEALQEPAANPLPP